ncbi:MAG: hypothetical protein LBP28_03065, partial [Coriobacteriales bacterium]|nr:hypothetical protein [Coriobacteriales bacterium]
ALGYHDEAETVIFEARAADVSSQQLELVQAQIHLQEDEPAKALAVAVPLCNGAEPEANARAALICADAYAALGDWPRRLDALQAAHSANPSPQTLRRLADAWLEQAALVASASEKASFYAKACEYLKPLCEQPYPGVLDRLNYSTALRASGELAASERLLLQLASEVAGDYRVPMQLAFLYEQKDELGKARSYCNQALAQIDSAPAAGAGSAGTGAGGAASGRGAAASDATNRELLLALQRRLSQ